MTRDREPDHFPPGAWVVTPSGAIGQVESVRGMQSRRDYFMRVVVRFGPKPRDTVILQAKLLRAADKNPETPKATERIEA